MAEYYFKEWGNEQTNENVINNAACLRWQAGLALCGKSWTGAFEDGQDSITDDEFNNLESLIHDALPSFSAKTFSGDGQHVPGTDEWNRIERGIRDAINQKYIDMLDGTADGYKAAMAQYFSDMGSPTDTDTITELCDSWYSLTRLDWTGYTEAPQPDSGDSFSKGGDNADMEVTPSTDTEANQDDYAGNPLFAVVDCNFIVDADTLNPKITAIDGVAGNFKRTDPDAYVGVLQQSGYIFGKETSSTYLYGISANEVSGYDFCRPLASSRNADGTRREWLVHAKFPSSCNDDGKLNSYSGGHPQGYMSHNTVRTAKNVNGSQYSGYCSSDHEFYMLMEWIKYGLTLDGKMQGCCNMNYQYYAQVSETGVTHILLSTSNGANVEPGMIFLVGTYDSSQSSPTDRGTSTVYNVSGQAGWLVTSKETVSVEGTSYVCVYFDTDGATFNPTANGSATDGSTFISSFRWVTGTTDSVLGNDGSPTDPTSGKYPFKLQGIEYMNGGYDLVGDVILSIYEDGDDKYYEPYIVNRSANQATSLSSNYVASGAPCLNTNSGSSSAWQYIRRNQFNGGIAFPHTLGGSSSTFCKDGFYQIAQSSTSTTREMAVRGALSTGVATAGASCVHGGTALSASSWNFGSRLSANGNRG